MFVENCDKKLRRKIATKNCCMFHNMKYIRKFVKINSFVNDNNKFLLNVKSKTTNFDACVDRFFFVINVVKIDSCIDFVKTNDDDVLYNDVLTKKT